MLAPCQIGCLTLFSAEPGVPVRKPFHGQDSSLSSPVRTDGCHRQFQESEDDPVPQGSGSAQPSSGKYLDRDVSVGPAATQSQAPPFGGSGPAQCQLLPRWPQDFQCCQVWGFSPRFEVFTLSDRDFQLELGKFVFNYCSSYRHISWNEEYLLVFWYFRTSHLASLGFSLRPPLALNIFMLPIDSYGTVFDSLSI